MTPDEYLGIQQLLLQCARIMLDLPLEAFLQQIAHADSIGPMVDPTLWRRGEARMHEIESLARAALAFQKQAKLMQQSAIP